MPIPYGADFDGTTMTIVIGPPTERGDLPADTVVLGEQCMVRTPPCPCAVVYCL